MGRLLDRVAGHTALVKSLVQLRVEDRVPGTLLFTGPEGVGRRFVAWGWAQTLLCAENPEGCGLCGSCLRVEKLQSEGLRVIRPEKNQIKIEQAREVLDFLSLQSLTPYRVVLIDGAESLNVQAANALLKVLEEPPPRTVFILIAPTPRHILPTLRSRSLHLHFQPLSPEEMAKVMKAPAWAYEASGGRLSKLQELLVDSENNDRGRVLEILQWWLEDPQSYLRPIFRERVKDRDFAVELARSFQGFFRDLECRRWGLELHLHFPEARALQEKFPASEAQSLFALSMGLERELKAHRDPQLLFEEFWIRSQKFAQGHA